MSNNTQNKYSLGYYLHLAFIAVVEELNRELRQAGLKITHPQFTLLQAVYRQPGLSQTELAKATAKDAAAVTRSLTYLEKQGLVERKWLNGCAKGVFLTPKAESLRPVLDKAIGRTIDRACANMDAAQVEQLNLSLRKMRETLIMGE